MARIHMIEQFAREGKPRENRQYEEKARPINISAIMVFHSIMILSPIIIFEASIVPIGSSRTLNDRG